MAGDTNKRYAVELTADASQMRKQLKGATDDAEGLEDELKKVDKLKVDPDIEVDAKPGHKAVQQLIDDIGDLKAKAASAQVTPDIDLSKLDKAEQKLESTAKATEHLGNEGAALGDRFGNARGVSDAFGAMDSAALDALEGFVDFGEGLEGIVPQAAGLGKMLGNIGFAGAAAGIALGAVTMVIDKLNEAQKEAEKRAKEWAKALGEAKGDVEAAFRSQAVSNWTEKQIKGLDTLGLTFDDVAASISGKVTPAMQKARDVSAQVKDATKGWNEAEDQIVPVLKDKAVALGYNEDQTYALFEAVKSTEGLLKNEAKAVEQGTGLYAARDRVLGDAEKATAALADAAQDQADAQEAANEQSQTALDLAEEIAGQYRTLADLTRDIADDQSDLAASTKEANKERGKNVELNNKAIDSSTKLADDLVDQARAQAAAKGQTLTSAAAQKLWNESMSKSASTMKGPLNAAMVDYIAQVNGIPPEKVTAIKAALAKGDLATANAMLDQAARDRDSVIRTTADLSAFQRAWESAIIKWKNEVGDLRSALVGIDARMAGGPARGTFLAGEAGPELVSVGGSRAMVTNSDQTARQLGAGSAAQPVVINYNISVAVAAGVQPAEVGRELVNNIKAFERANGTGWRRGTT